MNGISTFSRSRRWLCTPFGSISSILGDFYHQALPSTLAMIESSARHWAGQTSDHVGRLSSIHSTGLEWSRRPKTRHHSGRRRMNFLSLKRLARPTKGGTCKHTSRRARLSRHESSIGQGADRRLSSMDSIYEVAFAVECCQIPR